MYQPQQPQQQTATAVLYTVAGQPVTLTVPSRLYESYKSQQAVIAGVLLLITGVLSIVFNGIGIGLNEVFSFVGYGIWCGVLVSENLYLVKILLEMVHTECRDVCCHNNSVTYFYCVKDYSKTFSPHAVLLHRGSM